MTLLSGVVVATVVLGERALRELGVKVSRAIDAAGLTDDYVARVTGIPRNKLSQQLSGQLPLTGLYRLLASPELAERTTFRRELLEILAEDLGLAVVPRDLNELLGRVDCLLGLFAPPASNVAKPRMAKASLLAAVLEQELA